MPVSAVPRLALLLGLLASLAAPIARAQPGPALLERMRAAPAPAAAGVALTDLPVPERVVTLGRPRVAAAPGGGSVLVYEAFVRHEPFDEWQVVVQRFDADGRPLGDAVFFEPEDVCLGTDVWNEDGLTHAEAAFAPDGTLFVAAAHVGLRDLFNGFVQGSETTLGALAPDGRPVDLHPEVARCTQYKPLFAGLSTEYRPRLALTGRHVVLVQEGRFELEGQNAPEAPNSALHVVLDGVDAAFTQLAAPTVGQLIVHDDPLSRTATHEAPDVAASGERLAVVWQECPYTFVVENFDVVLRRSACTVRLRRATATADAVRADGEAVAVSTPAEGRFSITPSVAMDAAGGAVVVWADSRTGAQGDVFARRLAADGTPRGGEIAVSTGGGLLVTRPEVAVQPDGAFAVVWTDSTAAGLRALVRRFDAAGTPLGPPAPLDDAVSETALPDVAAAADDYLFAWLGRTGGAGGTLSLHAARDGRTVETERPLPAAHGPMLTLYPNPAATSVRVEAAGASTLVVHDLLGRVAARAAVPPDGRTRLDVQAWAPGLYLVRLDTPAGPVTRRLVVAR